MYEEPILANSEIAESVAIQDINEDGKVDALDRTSQDLNKSKLEEDEEYKLRSKKLILKWGLVFTFFR